MTKWSMYRTPVEHFHEVDDKPEPRTDPVGRVLKIVYYFAAIQSLTLLAVLWLCLK